MRPLSVILDSDPETTVMWSQWEIRKATIKGERITIHWMHGDLVIEASDPQLVCDRIFSHDQTAVIVKGKLGVKSVDYSAARKPDYSPSALRKALKQFLQDEDE